MFSASAIIVLSTLLPSLTSAYPFMDRPGAVEQYLKRAASVQGVSPSQSDVTFDAKSQLIDVSGAHAYVAPGSGDLRGPCPGLNALANHNYLPHNGIISLTQAIQATNQVFGMSLDLGGFLSTYATLIDGDPLGLSWSIGGSYTPVTSLGGLLGTPGGLSGSHNKYESDASPGRGDSYLNNGDASTLNKANFQKLYALQSGETGGNYDIDVLIVHAQETIDYSRANNAQFFWGPFSGILVSQAAFSFIPAFMSNHTAEHPQGVLTQDVLKTFFGVTGTQGNLVVNKGQERIPANWYRRAVGNEYSIAKFAIDNTLIQTAVPERLAVGGNLGTPGSFAGVDISNLTGGVYNAQNLLNGNNAICFSMTTLLTVIPDALKSIVSDVTSALTLVNKYITPNIAQFNCPELTTYNKDLYSKFPGAPSTVL